MATFRVMHRDGENQGRFEDIESSDTAQAIWQAAQNASGGSLVAAYELGPDGLPVASVPASSSVE